MDVVSLPLDQVHPYQGNPRRNKDAVAKVAASIREFGFRQPIVVDADGVVIAGHTRLLAARELGLDSVPVHVAQGLTPAQVRAYRLADNRTNEEASWDEALLAEELRALEAVGFDLKLTAFEPVELHDLLRKLGEGEGPDPDEAPPVPALVRSEPGTVWLLGPHRVGCCDATKAHEVRVALGGALADLVWTDPPYNVAYSSKAGKIANDDMGAAAFLAFLRDALAAAASVMKPGAAIYVAHSDTEGLNFRTAFRDAGFKISGCIVWRKDALVLGRSDYQWQHEPILYGWKPGSAHRWYGGRKQTTILDMGASPFAPTGDGRWQITIGDRVMIVAGDVTVEEVVPSVITEARPKRSALHPTMKPTALIERLLKNNGRPGDLVFDPFGGSGSTLIAADRLGMSAVLTELDRAYCDVIVQRWQDFSGRRATRESDGLAFDAVPARALPTES
jgi:DNA modification methylase